MELDTHFIAYIIQHVDNVLIILFPSLFLTPQIVTNPKQFISEVFHLVHLFEGVESEHNL